MLAGLPVQKCNNSAWMGLKDRYESDCVNSVHQNEAEEFAGLATKRSFTN